MEIHPTREVTVRRHHRWFVAILYDLSNEEARAFCTEPGASVALSDGRRTSARGPMCLDCELSWSDAPDPTYCSGPP
jgi:hypothetical protein